VRKKILAFLATQVVGLEMCTENLNPIPPEFMKIAVPYNLTFIKAPKKRQHNIFLHACSIGNPRNREKINPQEPPAFY